MKTPLTSPTEAPALEVPTYESAPGVSLTRLLYAALLTTAVIASDGQVTHVVALCVILADLFLSLGDRTRFMQLATSWKVGYLLLVCREGLMDREFVEQVAGQQAYNVASRFVTASFAMVLLAHSLYCHRVRRQRRAVQRIGPAQLSPERWLYTLIAVSVLYLIHEAQTVQIHLEGGRAAALALGIERSVLGPVVSGFFLSTAIVLPPMIAYYFVWLRRASALMALCCALPIVGLQFFLGTRFVLLMSVAGLTLVIATRHHIRMRTILLLALSALLLGVASSLMASFRYEGLSTLSWDRYIQYLEDNKVLHSEGIIRYLALLVNHFEATPHHYGTSTAALLLFWIPRALWETKPTLLGYWFIRQSTDMGFDAGHSVAFTFAGDAYVDFGFWGGILFCAVIGLLLGWLDRFGTRVTKTPGDPYVLFSGPMYGTVFFAVRSFDTALIVTMGVLSLTWLAIRLGLRKRISIPVAR